VFEQKVPPCHRDVIVGKAPWIRLMFIVDFFMACRARQVQWLIQGAGVHESCVRVEIVWKHLCAQRKDGGTLLAACVV
jgi:hypothetical protein